jgi:hypothetical protein
MVLSKSVLGLVSLHSTSLFWYEPYGLAKSHVGTLAYRDLTPFVPLAMWAPRFYSRVRMSWVS